MLSLVLSHLWNFNGFSQLNLARPPIPYKMISFQKINWIVGCSHKSLSKLHALPSLKKFQANKIWLSNRWSLKCCWKYEFDAKVKLCVSLRKAHGHLCICIKYIFIYIFELVIGFVWWALSYFPAFSHNSWHIKIYDECKRR